LGIGLLALLVICGAAYFLYSGFGQSVGPVIEVDATLRDLYSGPLKIGAGKTELTDGMYVITSSEGLATNYAISTVEVTDFRASSIFEVLEREGYMHYAGIVYITSQSGFLDGGSIIFGKDGLKIFVSRIVNNVWERILSTDIMSNPRYPYKFEIVRQDGSYRILLNGEEIVTYESPYPETGWPQFYVMEDSKAEFTDWSVYKFQKAVMSPPEYGTDRKG